MAELAKGLILRTRPLTETSLIVQWLTREFGRMATVAKGARRPKSPFSGKLDLFYLADFSFVRSTRSELHALREVAVYETHPILRRELSCLRQVSYFASLVELATETETPIPEVFVLLLTLIQQLPALPPSPKTVFAFEFKLLSEIGLRPDLTQTALKPGTKAIVEKLLEGDWSLLATLQLSESQIHELRQFLHGFLIYHLGKLPRGRDGALEM